MLNIQSSISNVQVREEHEEGHEDSETPPAGYASRAQYPSKGEDLVLGFGLLLT
jgi:hypothetical protein